MLDLSFLHELEVESRGEVERVEAGVSGDGGIVKDSGLLHERHSGAHFHGDGGM